MRTVLPSVITAMQRIANGSDTLSFQLQAISYKPFLSLFNMTGVAEATPTVAGVGMLIPLRYLAFPLIVLGT